MTVFPSGVSSIPAKSSIISNIMKPKRSRSPRFLRPSYILGVGDAFTDYVIKHIMKREEVSIYGSGRYRIQPIFRSDVVKIYRKAIEKGISNKTFDLVGDRKIEFVEYARLLAKALDKKIVFKRVSLEDAMQDTVKPISKRIWNKDLGADELLVLVSDSVSNSGRLKSAFEMKLTPLNDVVKTVAKNYR